MNEPKTLPELAADAIDRLGERVTMVYQNEKVLNTTIYDRAKRLHGAFTEMGLGAGDVMCLCMVNHPMVNSVFGGGFRTAATVVPVMFQLTPPELEYIFGHTEAKVIITDTTLVDKVREAVKNLPHVEWIAVLGGETDETKTPREYSLESLLEHEPLEVIPNIDPDDTALMLYTSGTTGKPKGVMLTHNILITGSLSGLRASELDHQVHPAISISALPMAHIYGVGVMNSGYVMPKEYEPGYLVQEVWFDPLKFMQLIDEHKCTSMASVPTMLSMMLNHPDIDKYDLRSLSVVTCGAAPVPVEVADGFMERTGCRIRQVYGMTENAGMATADRVSQPFKHGSAGKAYDVTDLRIMDDDGNFIPAGERGEIVTKSATTMKGYFKNPEATAETIVDGWLHTGDIGYLDEDGWLFVVDRKKDMIIKGGENIFPAEIENILYEHDDIAEAAVIGVPDDVYGEEVVAYVVASEGKELTEPQVIEHVKASVSKFKAPKHVYFLDALPKSGVGKILRRELRDRVQMDD
jgi:long-chain acyl-CoA synthetase